MFGGDRAIVLARELTKLHEEFWRGTVSEAIAHHTQRNPQGEYTLIVAGATLSEPQWSDDDLRLELQQMISQGLSRSQASRQLADRTDLSRRHIYQLALALPESPEESF